jgi:hypothetical protein
MVALPSSPSPHNDTLLLFLIFNPLLELTIGAVFCYGPNLATSCEAHPWHMVSSFKCPSSYQTDSEWLFLSHTVLPTLCRCISSIWLPQLSQSILGLRSFTFSKEATVGPALQGDLLFLHFSKVLTHQPLSSALCHATNLSATGCSCSLDWPSRTVSSRT